MRLNWWNRTFTPLGKGFFIMLIILFGVSLGFGISIGIETMKIMGLW